MKNVFVIIVIYNTAHRIDRLISLLQKEGGHTKDWHLSVVLVDNGQAHHPELSRGISNFKYIHTSTNEGFAAGCNIGIRHALQHGADAVLLLNPDTKPDTGFLQPLLNHAADITAPIIRFRRRTGWVYDYGGIVSKWTGETRHRETLAVSSQQSAADSGGIDYVSGCCMRIKKTVLETIGLLDERYFLYYEDVDFCLRARGEGLQIAVISSSLVEHALEEGKKKSWEKRLWHLSGALTFINSWIPWHRRPVAYGYWFLLLLKVAVGTTFNR